MSRRLRAREWSCVGLLVFALLASESPASAKDPDDLVAEAIRANPSVEAMRERTRELRELADISDTWPDPRLSVEYVNAPVDTFSIDDHPMGGVQFKLQQRLPEWGWSRASRKVADHRVERSRHAREEAEVQLRASVETLYWQLTQSRLLEQLTQEHLARTLELVRAVRVRYEVGRTGQNALLRLDVLRDRLDDDLGDYERADQRLCAGLARALARDAATRFETPDAVDAVAPEGDGARWVELATGSRPLLAALREEIREQESAAELARIGVRPDVDLWVTYRYRNVDTPLDDGTDFVSAGVSLPIPWGSAQRASGGAAASEAARDGAQARLAAALDEIESDSIAIHASWQRAARKAATYGDVLIPAAVAALETTLSDFAVGKAEFSTLYEAEIELLTLQRMHLMARVETHLQRAAARALTGVVDLGGSS